VRGPLPRRSRKRPQPSCTCPRSARTLSAGALGARAGRDAQGGLNNPRSPNTHPRVLDGEQHEAVLVLSKERLVGSELSIDAAHLQVQISVAGWHFELATVGSPKPSSRAPLSPRLAISRGYYSSEHQRAGEGAREGRSPSVADADRPLARPAPDSPFEPTGRTRHAPPRGVRLPSGG
jgi:hypothetical protein